MKTLIISKDSLLTRNHASQYNDYDEIDCRHAGIMVGSALHELIQRNPKAKYIVLNHQSYLFEHLLETIRDDNRIIDKPSITIEIKEQTGYGLSRGIEAIKTFQIMPISENALKQEWVKRVVTFVKRNED